MDDYHFLHIIALVVPSIVVIGQLIYSQNQTYLNRQAQNKADKESIEELTRLVEEVKVELLRESAKLSSELEVLKDRKTKNYTQSQQAIISFYTNITTWGRYCLTTSYETHRNITDQELTEYITNMHSLSDKTFNSSALVNLLVEDITVIDAGQDAIQSAIDLENLVEGGILQYTILLLDLDDAEKLEKKENSFELSAQEILFFNNNVQAKKNNIITHRTNFLDEVRFKYAELEGLCNLYKDLSRIYLMQ